MWNVISFLRKSFSKKFVSRRSSFCPSILKWNKHCKLFWCLTKQKRDKLICLIVWKRDTYLVLVILMLFAFRTFFQAERGWKALKIPAEFSFWTLREEWFNEVAFYFGIENFWHFSMFLFCSSSVLVTQQLQLSFNAAKWKRNKRTHFICYFYRFLFTFFEFDFLFVSKNNFDIFPLSSLGNWRHKL